MTQESESMPRVIAKGQKRAPWDDMYHGLLTASWLRFFALLIVGFLTVNFCFAFLYRLEPQSVSRVDSFEDAFYFSVQTLGTIGYGGMSPETRYGHILVTIEALMGLLSTALITGLTFARFARPSARVIFSRHMVIANRNGKPYLMIRMANARLNNISEAKVRIAMLVSETSLEGERFTRFLDLKLVRDNVMTFIISWTAMHAIEEGSPFFGEGALQKLKDANTDFFVTLTGHDVSLGAPVHARHGYRARDILERSRFADVVQRLPDGTRVLDHSQFHEVIPDEPRSV